MDAELKELLTLAAKACGWVHYPAGEIEPQTEEAGWIDPATGDIYWEDLWAPHLDDGDGARMETKLEIDLSWGKTFVFAGHRASATKPHSERYADHNGDEQAARRWASLRAAAQIGRQMP